MNLELIRNHLLTTKPIEPKPLVADLKHGWLLPYLLHADSLMWRRWEHWFDTMQAGEVIGSIPQIEWCNHLVGRKMLERSLATITRNGDWQGWGSWRCFDYLLDWLLFGFGHSSQSELPVEPSDCLGASNRLYQVFNLVALLAYPHDYFGDILADNRHGRHLGFFPTPMDVVQVIVRMTIGEEDARSKTVCDPAVGTGRMLLCASNHSYRLHGNDVNQTVIKATLINGYLYAPWLVKPFPFLCKLP
jgi:hypothetical protein